MLSRFHVPQPIRTYSQPDGRGICPSCANDVFTSSLHQSLSRARDEPSVTHSYSSVARDLYASILAGCPWCSCIGNAILTCSDLDYWMEAWNGSQSDGDSLDQDSPQQGPSEPEALVPPKEAVGDTATDEDMVDVVDSGSSDHEAADGVGETPGFLTIESLNCGARMEITIEFLKWNGSLLFNLVEVRVEVATSPEDDSPLQDMTGDKAVAMKLEVMCESKTCETAAFNQQWDVVSAALFHGWVPRAQTWLRACKAHTSCSPSGAFRPTRLIEVRDPRHPRLVISAEDIPQNTTLSYIALSYVWGSNQAYTLTEASLSDLRRGLDPARLPKTLSDAIAATYQLGFMYLWIDALCIIQDSPGDKALELPRMADTYKESVLTLIIASATAASDGFLKTPSPARFFLQPFQVGSGLTFGYRTPYKASADPISSRAWTLQERVLSRRLLIFSSTGVMWMCREDFINPAAAPDAGPPYQTFLDPYLSASHPSEQPVLGDEDAQAQIRETWAAIRADYTEMALSYYTDKLPAISALAAEIGAKTGWTYLAGMWKEDLFSDLHWRCMKQSLTGDRFTLKPAKVKEAGYIAPSWSWASVGIGAVVGSEDERDDREVFDFSILECQVDTLYPGFSYGPVKHGYLEVTGKTVELGWRYEDRPSWDGSDISLIEECDTQLVVGDGTLDPLDEPLDPDIKVTCLGMSKLRLGRQRIVPVEGLILVPKRDGGAAFRRIGFFRMAAPSVFDAATVRALRIE
ncbi:heterokaryon incompatibility protein-domain-containing protein [Echria macrotheca]|uniref:Heterokaryon incompatibility protein-domain-containing protein n=1 Tax=Echria macrotheca TaxID=438768 RepID=A0AAJ0F670_9PEZI|nr:heterokaryon incompatibility protein-domain-containing protein [Echria macrotheca]